MFGLYSLAKRCLAMIYILNVASVWSLRRPDQFSALCQILLHSLCALWFPVVMFMKVSLSLSLSLHALCLHPLVQVIATRIYSAFVWEAAARKNSVQCRRSTPVLARSLAIVSAANWNWWWGHDWKQPPNEGVMALTLNPEFMRVL